MAGGLGLYVALLVLLVVKWSHCAENVSKCENTPMKQIICEFGTAKAIAEFNACLCTHIAIPVSLESEKDDDQTLDFTPTIKSYRETNGELKSLAAVTMYAEDVAKKSNQIRKEIVDVLDHYDGVQLDLRQSDVSVDKSLVVHFFKELSSEIDNRFRVTLTNSSLESFKKTKEIQLVLPPNAAILTKYYDLKKLTKFVDFFIIATHNLVDSSEQGYTYHPSRLMGTDDLLNADSLVDLVIGLGVNHSSILISLPSTASKFELKDSAKNTPRAPAIGLPTTISRQKMCEEMKKGNWTIERDEDLTAPYAFMNNTWMSFDDSVSVSIKGKYVLLRDLAGAVVTDVEALDWKSTCLNQTEVEPLKELAKTFVETARKSRSAQLLSLQEQLQQPADQGFYFNNEISYSPYYIERVVTRDGEVHAIRKDTKTEFECSRQGYFRHPSGCNRFYRCVKFDQQSNYFTVYEYDCPDGLAFDEKVEVCVWPGSLSDTGACQGSSEIAPVPRNQFVCPPIEGYYADSENCRWFFACLDHGRDGYTPLTAYEFRCPFGLVFDEKSLKCDWPWKVGSCGNSGQSYVRNYGEQPHVEQAYQRNQFNALYEKAPFVPNAQYNQDRPRFSIDSIDTHLAPDGFNLPFSTTEKPRFSFGPTENYVPSNSAGFSYNSAQSYAPTSARIPYSSPEKYFSTIKPAQTFYGSTTTSRPQSSYGYTSTTVKPEFSYGSTESYATTSKPQLFYSPTVNHLSSVQPQYGSTEAYSTTSKPRFSYGSQGTSEPYSTTSKPPFSYGPAEYFSTTIKPQIVHSEANVYVGPNQSGRSLDFDYNQFDGPLGVLFHQRHEPKTGTLLHQQNNFHSIPVNLNYDSHKNDIQYPPIKDYETYSTTSGPLTKASGFRLYSENYSPSNVHSGPAVPYTGSYSVLAGYDSQRQVNEHYQPSYESETYSTTTQRPIVKSSTYLQPIFAAKPTSKPFSEYSNVAYSTTSSPYVSAASPSVVVDSEDSYRGISSNALSSRFDLGDYRSRIPSTTPLYSAASTATAKSTAFNYGSPSTTFDVPAYSAYSSTPKAEAYRGQVYESQSSSYPSTTEKPIISSTPYSAYSSTFKPTVNYYNSPVPAHVKPVPTAYVTPVPSYASSVSHDDSAFVNRLIAELSKVPLAPALQYSGATAAPYSTGALASPTSVYLRSGPTTTTQASVQRLQSPTVQYAPSSFDSVAYSARPLISTHTSRPETLAGYSSTVSDLIDYYHDLHSSLDSAYRSPFPQLHYAAPVGDLAQETVNYTLPRGYALDAGHNVHNALYYPAAAVGPYPLKPIVVEPVSAELNAEFERYYTAGVREHLRGEDDGRVLVVGDSNTPLVGKLVAQCDCAAKKAKPKTTVVSTTTSTVIGGDDDDDFEKTVKAVETRTKVVLEDVVKKRPAPGGKQCNRPGLFRDPKQCNRFYSCNWDKWTQKYQISDFKCPIHLAFDENLSACNWPSKGPACSRDTLISYAN